MVFITFKIGEKKMNYFDFAATCPIDKDASAAFVKASNEYFGNTSSLHNIGSNANNLLEHCRSEMAKFLNVRKEGIYFTSGGSESNYLAIRALLSATGKKGKHIITGFAEHSSIQSTMNLLSNEGYDITYLPFHKEGIIDIVEFQKNIREDTVMVSIQHANSEIGTIQPIIEIGAICKENKLLFHSDCVQTFGKIPLQEVARTVDSLSISSHKFYGPKGVGVVYINPEIGWKSYLPGTTHENGFRPGTVNVPSIAAMLTAASKAHRLLEQNNSHYQLLRKAFIKSLKKLESQIVIYDAKESQLPSTVGMRVKGIEGQWIMLECNRRGYAISTGSACQTGLQTPSKTMLALGLSDACAKEFIRISFGWQTSIEDVLRLGETIIAIIKEFHQP